LEVNLRRFGALFSFSAAARHRRPAIKFAVHSAFLEIGHAPPPDPSQLQSDAIILVKSTMLISLS